ncbi:MULTISPECIES: acyl-CoA dehydrogenase family protein [unclassified Lysobacter]|uniref:acyl-CoA dehydrogenase family protein n=1 Tax=unclassified Lysobacter TaxID=2635362 RepID=UPI001BE9068F|nr:MULTISPECIES: acyl-CoA dehydrogenase family protein [unclassified Lysobacter]MBT2747490.1 acyl-CoA dehydrogenase family protein [Lysobacter sp. ISL-42]MBT2752736.1 acyl-CoA dehydrogenase family protein [Lysobacter sp. ISL-50]MBT2778393.1 acyl-CoA dehydrogenase family protein [Lysobacter sp. ISL-54]MBT2783911.1 acyl-CoA dehydrogenase family protein [Lysobacter sp. ISL-52]
MDFAPSARTQAYLQRLQAFIAEYVAPFDAQYRRENAETNAGADWRQWRVHPRIAQLKALAREAGLWNLFLPDAELGAGLSVLEYAPLAEAMGHYEFAAEIFNCNAPDTGNMEVLYHFGSDAQKAQWLRPLLDGQIRSVFCMTEPDVASSDATNMQAEVKEDGDWLVLNGRKWWSTGIGHPEAKLAIFMGLSDPQAAPHARHSMVLAPLDAPGVRIERMLPTFGEYDPPYGHGEVVFDNVRVPRDQLILGLGQGFAIAQGRLGPGRIHHCMRAIGAAERALELTIRRGSSREAFGQPILRLGGNLERVAQARMAIDQARLLTLYAAWKIQNFGVKNAMTEISAIKVIAPNMLQTIVDQAIQIHGGAGVSHDVPLTGLFMIARALRIADGPDEVHSAMVARMELAKYGIGRGRKQEAA